MILVDAHVHTVQNWYEPVETLLFEMEKNGVAKAVLIQSLGVFDNSYLFECVHSYPGRFAAAVLVDHKRADATDTLEKLAEKGAAGIRLGADWRSPGPDPLAIWRKTSELGLVVSLLGTPEELAADEFRRLVEELPDLKIVLEHLGGIARGQGPLAQPDDPGVVKKVIALAKYPNICIKLTGFGEFLPKSAITSGKPIRELPPFLHMAYESFGRQRMMWGSNFPPVARMEGYRNALRLPLENIPFFTKEDKEWIFGKTALSVWKL